MVQGFRRGLLVSPIPGSCSVKLNDVCLLSQFSVILLVSTKFHPGDGEGGGWGRRGMGKEGDEGRYYFILLLISLVNEFMCKFGGT